MQNKIQKQPNLQIFEILQYQEILVFYRICAFDECSTEALKSEFYFLDATYLEDLLQKMRQMELISGSRGLTRQWVCPEQGPQTQDTITHWRVTETGKNLIK